MWKKRCKISSTNLTMSKKNSKINMAKNNSIIARALVKSSKVHLAWSKWMLIVRDNSKSKIFNRFNPTLERSDSVWRQRSTRKETKVHGNMSRCSRSTRDASVTVTSNVKLK